MKRISLSCLLLLIALGTSAAGLDDLIKKAGGEYARGNAPDALATLGTALSTNPTAVDARRSLSDAYTEIGVKEYDRKNFKNAFECFKNAVKLYPSNQLATKYFWKMKGEMNVEKLGNETEAVAQKSPSTAQGEGADTAAYRETAEKLSRTEQELEALRKSTSAATQESAVLKAELERQKREAEQQLAAIRTAALTASQESAAVKAELERQRMIAEQQREELRTTSQAVREESLSLKSDLGQYRVMIDQLNSRVQKNDQSTGKDAKVLADMLSLFQKQSSADKIEAQRIADQLAEQRRLLDAQNQALSSRNIFLIGGLGLVVLLVILFILLFVRAQLRRKRAWRAREIAVPYTATLGRESAAEERGHNGGSGSLLLDFYPETSKATDAEPREGEAGMYRDLMRAERIRRMHEQMKQGTLKWETVREYVGELEKDLRVEILKVVETKILEGEGADPRAILPIVSAFLTEHDDYLREKAESLVRDALAGGQHGARTLLPSYMQESPQDTDDSPLGLPKLLEITENLKKVLKDRERSLATAKAARGMARFLGLTSADTDLLYKATLAHDAGYLLLDPDKLTRILGKPALSEEDFAFVRSHARKGVEYFKGTKLPQEMKDAILFHHERNDGTGYPKGLRGEKIPLFAKIIGVAETWVALTSARPYREKLSREAALAVIRDGVGRKFDLAHIEALADMTRHGGESL
jgi:HD-GYP domain-containing protein (c-di-GMP phosphodiesterase class II)